MIQKSNTDLKIIPSHGTLLEIESLGVLITGESGIGKTECALALVSEGALLVCDDAPIFTIEDKNIIGKCCQEYRGYMHIRQLGMIYLPEYFPNQETFSEQTELKLIIQLKAGLKENKNVLDIPVVVDRPDYKVINLGGIKIYQLMLYIFPTSHIPLLVKLAIKQFKFLKKFK